ncbi:hypothetical protein ACLB2K_022888 [Fragaria x ananassa]
MLTGLKHFGHHILAASKNLGATNVLSSEALALRDGSQRLLQISSQPIDIEGDSKVLMDVLLNRSCCPWRIKFIVDNIRMLAA